LRANADARSTSGMIRVGAGPVSITAMGRTADRGVPGAVVDGARPQPRARLDDLDLWALATAKIVDATSSSVELRLGGRYLDQHYVDPDATFSGLDGIDARYLLRDVSGDAVWRLSSLEVMHRATLSAGYVDLRGESLDPDIDSLAVRRTAALSYDVQWTVDERLLVEAALRGDVYSDVGSAVSGSLGGRWKVQPDLVMRASIGTGFRPPSFNELYFLNYGNTDLKPERSIMASIGGMWSPTSWFNIDANLFTSQITDLIVGIPMSPVITSAQNIGNAVSYGVELAARFSLLEDRVFGQWSYTLQRVEDRTGRPGIDGTLVPYVPMELIAVQSWWDDGSTIASLEWNYASYRYAQPGAESTSLLAPYHLVHASVGQVIAARDVKMTVLFRIDNIFDERYVVIRGYPMPGRTLRLTLSVGA
ncbi:MAG: TonB-dependent receptor, partial [Ignavibacteriae bacterium]